MSKSDREIISEYEESYRQAMECWHPYIDQASTDYRFYAGNQFSDQEKSYLSRQQRPALVYNKVLRVVNNVSGYQRRNRMGIACEPVEGSDVETADIFSDLLTWNMQAQNGYNVISDAFKGAVICGLNLVSTWIDYEKDQEYGDIRLQREPYNSFLVDPYWGGNADMRDCRFVMRRRYVSKQQAMALLPDYKKDIKKLKCGGYDGKYSHMSYSNKGVGELLAYDEYYTRRTKQAKLLINRLDGSTRIFKGSSRALNAFLSDYASVVIPTGESVSLRFSEFVEARDITVTEVDMNVIVENELMYSGGQPSGLDEYPFTPVVGYYLPEMDDYSNKLQGIVRCMRDPQTDLNRQRSKILDMINSKASTGWVYKNGSVVNHEDLFKTGQGVQIVLDKDAQMTDLQPIVASDIPTGTFNYTQMIDQDINSITGVTAENLGMVDEGSQISGTAIKLRQASGTTTLSEFFDNLDLSQKVIGNKMMKLMQKNWNSEKVERITGKPPTEEFYKESFGKYDSIVKETNLTDSQRTLGYVQGLQARAAGIPIPDKFLIEEMPIADKSKLMKYYEEEKEQESAQQEKINEQEVLSMELANAQKEQMLSLAQERRARVISDISLAEERTSEAAENRSQAALNRAKTMSEISELETDNFLKVLEFVNMLQLQEKMDREAVSDKIFQRSKEINATTEGSAENESAQANQQNQQAQIAQALQALQANQQNTQDMGV